MPKFEWTADDFYSFLKDPVFMHKVIFDKDLPPHQQAMLKGMWFRPVYCDTSGYRSAKSRTATYCQMMQSILISGWMDGIFSHSKRGSDILFREHIDQEYADNPKFRVFVARKPSHRDEGSRCIYKNGSQNIAYPADILGDGQKLESISLHAATVDETTAIPKPDIIWNVFMNRITMPMPRVARLLGITNNVRLIGAAKYSFQLVYQAQGERGGLIKMVIRKMIEQGRANPNQPLDYLFQSFNLRYLPRDEICYCGGPTELDSREHEDGHTYVQCRRCGMTRIAWRVFFRGALMRMNDIETLMTKVLFAMRWLGIWQRVSEELYSGHAVENMKNPGCFLELTRPLRQQKAIYVMAVDVARGRREQSSVSAITIIKRVPPDPFYYVVYSKKHRLNLTELSGAIYALYEKFSPSVIMIDPGGGGNWLVDNDHLGANKQTIITASGKVERETMPLLMMDAPPMERGVRVLQLWQHNMKLLKDSLGTFRWPDELMNWAHGIARGFINDAKVLRPVSDALEDETRNNMTAEVFDDIEEAANGLTQIGIVQDENGTPLLTSHSMFQYNPKPDLAYSLVYAICTMYMFAHEKRAELLEEDNEEMAAITSALESIHYPENAPSALKIPDPDDEEMVFLSSDSPW
jgi:phage terminase large subunit-like protein